MAGPSDILFAAMNTPIASDQLGGLQAQRAAQEKAQLQQQQLVQAIQKAASDQARLKQVQDAAIKTPSAKTYSDLLVVNPQAFEGIKQAHAGMRQEEQDATLQELSAIRGYLGAGKPQEATRLIQRRIDADKKAGQDTSDDEQMLAFITQNPDGAKGLVDYQLAGIMGPEKWSASFEAIGKEGRANAEFPGVMAKTKAETDKLKAEAAAEPIKAAATMTSAVASQTQAQVAARKAEADIQNAANRLELDRDTLQSNVQLKLEELGAKGVAISPGSEAAMTNAVVSAESSRALANRAKEAREKIEADTNFSGGWGAVLAQGLTGISGKDSAQQQLRRQYEALMISQAIKNLPPGPASDKDVKMAMRGFPDRNANKETITSFLAGMEKLQNIAANRDQARADWISENGDIGKAKRDLTVNGVRVPKGATYADYSNSAAAGEKRESVGERSYMKYAQ